MLKPNPFNWVSIPTADIDRAITFYNSVFELSLEKVEMLGDDLAFFNMDQDAYGASGALIAGETPPGQDGPVVFFGCADDLQNTLDRVADAGGQVQAPKFPIGENGFLAFFTDSEGNKIGLHSEV